MMMTSRIRTAVPVSMTMSPPRLVRPRGVAPRPVGLQPSMLWLHHNRMKMVDLEGVAPSSLGCKPSARPHGQAQVGAPSGGRTHTPLRAPPPQGGLSTDSSIGARLAARATSRRLDLGWKRVR